MRIAIIGAGLGGITLAALLERAGISVSIYEQADSFARLGAGIHLGPNMMKVMRTLGVEDALLNVGFPLDAWNSVDYKSGETIFRLPLRGVSESLYGASYLAIHRGDFHAVLERTIPHEIVEFKKKLTDMVTTDDGVTLAFGDGSSTMADIVVGADGVNSRVRACLLGAQKPKYTGKVAYRGMVPVNDMKDAHVGDCTKWWGPDRHVMVYFMSPARDVVYYVAITPEDAWPHPGSMVNANLGELVDAYKDFHPTVRAMTEATTEATKWAIFERDPLPLWSADRVVLLGDACHPMKPHMGQGAAMAIEDAALLARCIIHNRPENYQTAFRQYERNRVDRASQVQAESQKNRWLKADTDHAWVFAYDPMEVPLVPAV